MIKERCDLEVLPETIVAEIKLHKKKVFIVLSYCHPDMSNDELVDYMCVKWRTSTNPSDVGILMQGLLCFGKVILRTAREVYSIIF